MHKEGSRFTSVFEQSVRAIERCPFFQSIEGIKVNGSTSTTLKTAVDSTSLVDTKSELVGSGNKPHQNNGNRLQTAHTGLRLGAVVNNNKIKMKLRKQSKYPPAVWKPRYNDWNREKNRCGISQRDWAAEQQPPLDPDEVVKAFKALRADKSKRSRKTAQKQARRKLSQ
jgi:hypothetical protein